MRKQVMGWLGVAFLTALTFIYFLWTYNPVSQRDIGYRILSDFQVEVEFEVTRPNGIIVLCEIEALNETFAVVGWKQVEIPASQRLTTREKRTLTTTQAAVTGVVRRCWLN